MPPRLRVAASTALSLLLLALPISSGPVYHPADVDFSGDITAQELSDFNAVWLAGQEGIRNDLSNAAYLIQNGGCYYYNPATALWEPRACAPVVAAPVIHFFRENPKPVKATAPVVHFYRENPKPVKTTAPIIHFYREQPKPVKTTAPTIHFYREDPT